MQVYFDRHSYILELFDQIVKFIIIALLVLVIFGASQVYAQEETDQEPIPKWIKIVAGAWYDDEINDSEYTNAMEFLIERGLITISSSNYHTTDSETDVGLMADNIALASEIEKLKSEKIDLETTLVQVMADSKQKTENWKKAELELEEIQDSDFNPEIAAHLRGQLDIIVNERDNWILKHDSLEQKTENQNYRYENIINDMEESFAKKYKLLESENKKLKLQIENKTG